MSGKLLRWFASLAVLTLVLLTWWLTVTDWESEFSGFYNLTRAIFNVVISVSGLVLIYFLLSEKPVRHKIFTVTTAVLTTTFSLFILALLLQDVCMRW